LPLFHQAIAAEPGNLEARFDLSQVQNRLGLRDRERRSYQDILRLDPRHSLVRHALRKHRVTGRPSLRVIYERWDEEGRGELARMSRWRWGLTGEVPLGPRWRLGLGQNRWEYHPGIWAGSFQATGPSLTLRGVANHWLQAEAGWQRQEFAANRRVPTQPLPDRDSGYARLRLAVDDRFELGLGLDRVDQFVNEIGLRDAVQARHRWLSAAWAGSRRVRLQGRWTRQHLTDDNEGRLFEWEAGFALNEHPRLLRLILSGDHRHFERTSVFVTRSGQLANIIHPYWTPRSYVGRALTVQYRADLSRRLLASTDHHFVDARFTRTADSEKNPGTRLELTWHYEFDWRWAIELRGMLHRSSQWDANSFGFSLERHF
jgi:hypothetical protein